MSSNHGVKDKVIIVTGASRGIGRAAALRLARGGAKTVLVARDQQRLQEVLSQIQDAGGIGAFYAANVADYAEVKEVIESAQTQFGRIDVLINNAGVIEPIAKLADIDPHAWANVLNINTLGVFNATRAVLPVMQRQGSGTIINMSSGAANAPLEGWSHYCASKAAAKMLTQSVHKEYGDAGITCVGLSPGTVATDMMRSIKQSGVNPVSQLEWESHIDTQDVANALAFLCTPAAREYAGTDFSIKTPEGRKAAGLD